ncbi:MAG TPA: MarR family transcriptional regulator [Pseudonocardia sp.]|jgi:DNA-binding MarR family transcriptional regulator|nr:MarR family transcriptional regulator [Pseudonocardia sp.]
MSSAAAHSANRGAEAGQEPAVESVWAGFTREDRDAITTVSTLMRATVAATHRIDQLLRPHGLTFARFEVLLLLSWTRSGSMTLSRMRDLLLVHQAAVTNLIDRLEADGLIVRVPHPHDRRATLANITDAGRTVIGPATASIAQQLRLGIPDADAEEILELVQRIRRADGEID